MDITPLTEKDRLDLAHMLTLGVDWVALSFVQRAEDVAEIQTLIDSNLHDIRENGGMVENGLADENIPDFSVYRPAVMSKIEKPSCFWGDELSRIIDLSEGIMVARGDLGVECPPEDVPILQKQVGWLHVKAIALLLVSAVTTSQGRCLLPTPLFCQHNNHEQCS